MTTKLHRIKSALRESIEMANKATEGPWTWKKKFSGSAEVVEPRIWLGESTALPQKQPHHNAAFLAHARTMTPLACKALLTAIEGLEQIMSYGNQAPTQIDGICPYGCDTPSIAEDTLSSIISEWPDV